MIPGKEIVFAKIALREGFLGVLELNDAFALQNLMERPAPLGEILVEQGVLAVEQVRTIQNLQQAFYPQAAGAAIDEFRGLLFATIAVVKHFCSEDDVHEALRIQERTERHIPITLGEVLIKRGYVNPEQVKEIVAFQKHALFACPRCDTIFNLPHAHRRRTPPSCPACTHALEASLDFSARRLVSGGGGGTPTASQLALATVAETTPDGTTSMRLRVVEVEPDNTPFSHPDSQETEPVFRSADAARAGGAERESTPTGKTRARQLGPYLILRELGRGGMGVVYQARHVNDESPRHAIKFLRKDLSKNEVYARRFARETELARNLRHENIVRTIETGVRDGFRFLVMEYIDGVNLGDVLDREGRLPVGRAVEIVRQAALALSYAHGQGVIHRDLKPDNILLEARPDAAAPHVKITDFGLAKDLAGLDDALTLTGQLIGTPHYMSPEQCRGEYSDQRSDIYSLGCTLYHLLCGQPPFVGDNYLAVMERQKAAPMIAPHEINPAVPQNVSFLIGKMMEKRPNKRYPTMELVAEHLALWDSDRLAREIRDFSGGAFARVRSYDPIGEAQAETRGDTSESGLPPPISVLRATMYSDSGRMRARIESGSASSRDRNDSSRHARTRAESRGESSNTRLRTSVVLVFLILVGALMGVAFIAGYLVSP